MGGRGYRDVRDPGSRGDARREPPPNRSGNPRERDSGRRPNDERVPHRLGPSGGPWPHRPAGADGLTGFPGDPNIVPGPNRSNQLATAPYQQPHLPDHNGDGWVAGRDGPGQHCPPNMAHPALYGPPSGLNGQPERAHAAWGPGSAPNTGSSSAPSHGGSGGGSSCYPQGPYQPQQGMVLRDNARSAGTPVLSTLCVLGYSPIRFIMGIARKYSHVKCSADAATLCRLRPHCHRWQAL